VNESGNEAAAFVVNSSFRLTSLTSLHKYIRSIAILLSLIQEKLMKPAKEAAKLAHVSCKTARNWKDPKHNIPTTLRN